MTLRVRLTLFYAAFFLFVGALVAASVYVLTERSLTHALEERAGQALEDLSRGAVVEGLRRLPGDAYYEVIVLGQGDRLPSDRDGVREGVPYVEPRLLRPNPTDDSLVAALDDEALARLLATGETTGTVELPSGERLQVLGDVGALAFPSRGVTLSAAVFVGLQADDVRRNLRHLAGHLIRILGVATIVFALGVYALSRRVLLPLERVTRTAAGVTGRDLSQRVPVPRTRDEVRDLAVTVNGMLDRLQESFETQRRFTADASHELRTPVTAIAGHAHYLLRRSAPTDVQRESLEVIRSEADRMGKLVGDLLELARADAGFALRREPLNLVDVLDAAREVVPPEGGDARVEVHAATPVVEVDGDPARLQQVVLNLVQNAVNAGASHVHVTAERDGDDARLEVADDGPGIPDEALPHLFDRFYRVDGARSGRGNGAGLGLAIVRWIVQQHGGRVDVDARPGEGTRFTVHLPAAPGRDDPAGDGRGPEEA